MLSEKAKQWEQKPHLAQEIIDSAEFLYPDLVYETVGGLMEVHNTLGPGFIARIYAKASLYEAKLRGLDPQHHRGMHVYFEGDDLGEVKFNHFQIEDKLLVFPVAIRSLDQIHLENLKEWMRHLDIPIGILANFSTMSLESVILRV